MPLVMMVTDRHAYGAPDGESLTRLVDATRRAVHAGVDLIQVRERGLEDDDLLALVRDITRSAAGTPCRVVVNDRVDIALAAQADGVHLPGRAVPTERVRRMVPEGFAIGRSVHTVAEAAEERSADYLVFGSVFPSKSKAPGHAVAGVAALAHACSAAACPVLAIGGMTAARLPDVARAGAAGIAAIGLFATATDRELQDIVAAIRATFGRS
jgi:thiamine-phosphate pyrophosphorylase